MKWRFATGGAIYSSPSIGADGTIYVGSLDDYLYAINPDGRLKWRFQTGGWVESSPAIGSDGTIYVGSYDGYMYAINPDGSLKWKFNTYYHGITSSPALGPDGTLYFGGSYCCVFALNPDGSLKWNFSTDEGVPSSPAIGLDGTVYAGSYDSHLYAINPDGTLKWKVAPGPIYASPAIGPDGTIYVGTMQVAANMGSLVAIAPDGGQRWNVPVPGGPVLSSAAVGADGTVYLESGGGHLYAINPDGSVKWTSFPGGVSSPVLDAKGALYAGGLYNSTLLRIDSSGAPTWNYQIGNYLGSSPSIGADGTIYVGSYDGNLYAFGSSPGTASSSTSSSTTSSTISTYTATASNVSGGCQGFAYVRNATLMLCGHPFSFVGVVEPTILAPFLGIQYLPGGPDVPDPNTILADAAAHGIKAVRFFLELADTPGGSDFPYSFGNGSLVMPYSLGNGTIVGGPVSGDAFGAFWQVYTKEPDHRTYFQGLDRLMADAKADGIYLEPELALCYGCWSKLGGGTDFFRVGSEANNIWKDFVRTVVSRYRNESQILWWDLAGEANDEIGTLGPCATSSCVLSGNLTSPMEISAWGSDSYDYIKSIDSNHLVNGGWNVPWVGYFPYYGGGENAFKKIVAEYDNMTFFRALNAKFDIASLHLYDLDILGDEGFIGANDLRDGTGMLIEHYADYSRNVLKKPFFVDETSGQLWAPSPPPLEIGYSPSPFVKYLLQDVVRYQLVGANFWGWDSDATNYLMSPKSTPEVSAWFEQYSAIMAAAGSTTITSSSTTTGSTTTSASATSTTTASVTPISTTPPTTSVTRQTETTTTTTTNGGGIPEFPYQSVAATVFTVLLVASYLIMRRRRLSI